MVEASAEEDQPEVLTMIRDASIEEADDATRLNERLKRRRRWCISGLRVLTFTAASEE